MTSTTRRYTKAECMAALLLKSMGGDDARALELLDTMGRDQWLALDTLYVGGCNLKRKPYVPSDETKRLIRDRIVSDRGNYDWIDELPDNVPDSAVRRAS